MLNAFLKVRGFEIFGTYETASGRTKTETSERNATQYAIDGVYRFGASEISLLACVTTQLKWNLLDFQTL